MDSSLVQIHGPSVAATTPAVPLHRGRVALVNMPWGSLYRPSLAIGVLKQCVIKAGFPADVHLLNVLLAERLGAEPYEEISNSAVAHSEWYFAQLLFGSRGLQEMRNDWTDLMANPQAEELLRSLKSNTGGALDLCARIAHEDVPQFIDDCMAIDWSPYTVVGFSTTFAQSLASLLLARRIKAAHPDVKIVFGGANVDGPMGAEFMRGFPWIDYVVHGEAERSFPALLEELAAGSTEPAIPGISIRREGKVVPGYTNAQPLADLNESPIPDYSDYVRSVERIGLRKKIGFRFYFESSRGCWWGAKHHCTFCGLNGTTMAYRAKTPERAYDEIMQLAGQYRSLYLSATDNILAMEYFSRLLPKLSETDMDLNIFYEVKANLTSAQLRLMRDAGIREIQPGIESFNSRILQLMRKGTTAIQNIQLLKLCHEYSIAPTWNLLYGFPGESPDDYQQLPAIFGLVSHLRPPTNVTRVIFQRFSPYFFDREAFGLTLSPWPVYQFLLPPNRVRYEEIAYYFDGEWNRNGHDPEEYIQPALDIYERWQALWKERKLACYYEKGPGYIVVHDSRLRPGVDHGYRKLYLSGPTAEIYTFCRETRSFKAIRQMLSERLPGDANETRVRGMLHSLVEQGLVFHESDRYLALAVRGRSNGDDRNSNATGERA